MNIDFSEEALLKESVSAAVVSRGGLSLSDLRELRWPYYEMALTELAELAKKMNSDG